MMYTIQSHPMDDYLGGRIGHGHQILIGLRYPYIVALEFDAEGKLCQAAIRPLRRYAKSIHEEGPFMIDDPEFREGVREQVEAWQREMDFREKAVLVQRFAIPELSLGIEDLPRAMEEFRKNPSVFSKEEQRDYPELVRDWVSAGNFVFWWGADYHLDKYGSII